MPGRTIAIGDIHGCSIALHALLKAISPRPDDTIVTLGDYVPGPHVTGRIAVVGHTPQPYGKILDLGHLKCIDTDCCHGGLLTALDISSGQLWQVNQRGELAS